MLEPTDIEKKSLEAHVELCAERYNALNEKLYNLDNKINSVATMVKEVKVCVTCGQPLPSEVTPLTNEMNNYLNPISNRVVCMNSSEDVVEVQGVKLYKVTGNKEGKPISKHIPVEPQAEVIAPAKPIVPPTVNKPIATK